MDEDRGRKWPDGADYGRGILARRLLKARMAAAMSTMTVSAIPIPDLGCRSLMAALHNAMVVPFGLA